MQKKADIGLIGLAVMGQNLVLNMNDNGFKVVVYNRTSSKTDDFMAGPARGTNVTAAYSIEELIGALARPRRVMLMIKAGPAVDAVIEQLLPLLEEGDIIIDGGNSHYADTERRVESLAEKGIHYIGTGISGGETGARYGPSIMPGGAAEAWPHVRPILQSVAAKVADGTPCCDWIGPSGSGHFVKMVHNGIEYGDMQLIAEAYDLMKTALGLSNEEMSDIFAGWNESKLDSYLIQITTEILRYRDAEGQAVIDYILDAAGQKGTGKWTAVAALEAGVPLTLIGEAVFARFLSSLKEEREAAANYLDGLESTFDGDKQAFIDAIREALYAAKIISYTQGYMLMREVCEAHGWELDYGRIALLWREGCIIRAAFLDKIKEAYDRSPDLTNLLLDPYFRDQVQNAQASWRQVVAKAAELGIPLPAMSSALAFYDGYRRARLPANLIQAQRDYFGAHTYERVDRPRGEHFHTDWIESGASVTSGSYNA